MDIGLLAIRLVVGLLFVGHGTQKLFGWLGGGGIEGTARYFGSIGYPAGPTMARLAGTGETLGGLFIALGFMTPFGAAAIIGVMVNAIVAAHWPSGVWNVNGGYEYPVVMATVATGLAFAGPGRMSLDRALELDLAGAAWGVIAIGLGLGGATVTLGARAKPEEAGAEAEEERRRAA